MYNSQYYTCEQIDERLLQGYLDDYNTQTGQSLTKAQFLTKLGSIFSKEGVIDNTATQIGYYECDTAAGTAAKAITVANYALFAGGSMKVKFANKNTANNATLNINSQGAKALYYQGERASATNSWDAEEVVEIYYDGTSYYANNVKGGSGSGVYDVSKEHPTSGPNSDGKFTLEYILNSSNVNELIPVNKRYPGMTIQFVSTSDNKYVQARCMADEFTTDTTQWAIAEEGVYVENPEFVYVKTDAEGKILWAIKTDGSVYYGTGCPQQVIDYIEKKIADSLDEYEDMVAFLQDFLGTDTTLKMLLDSLEERKVDKVEGKSLIDSEYAASQSVINSPEWADVKTDAEDKIIEGIQTDGTKVIGGDLNVGGDATIKGNVELTSESIQLVDNPEYLKVTTDAHGKVLNGVKKDGSHYIHNVQSESIDALNTRVDNTNTHVDEVDNKLHTLRKVSILGDSISTFNQDGFNIDGYAMYYPTASGDRGADVVSVEDTWWKQVINRQGEIIEINASYSGSTASSFVVGFSPRVPLLGNPDVIYIALGTNDSANNVPIGDFNYNAESYDLSQFAPAYIKGIKDTLAAYPKSEIICVAFDMGINYQNAIQTIAEHYGLRYFYVGDVSDVHPNKAEMKAAADVIMENLPITMEDNPEYIDAKTDSEGRLLAGRTPDGAAFENIGLSTPRLSVDGATVKHIEDPEGRIEVVTDSEGNILSYRKKDGTKVEESIELHNVVLNDKATSDIAYFLKAGGYTGITDWSDDEYVELPIPSVCAVVNLGVDSQANAKGLDIPTYIQYWDKAGNYFKKNILLNAQGSSSMYYYIKNQAIDLDDGSEIKFGHWPAFDSFHIKKYFIDVFRGQCIVGYWLTEQMYQTKPYGEKRPWDYLNSFSAINGANGKFAEDFDSGAMAHPDGFPVHVFFNGKDAGIYTFNIKKARGNYYMKKDKQKQIILDGHLGTTFWTANGDLSQTGVEGGNIWHDFEIRNPKISKDIDGNKYDGDNPKEPSDNYATTKAAIERLTTAISLTLAEETTEAQKSKFEEFFNIPFLIDYELISQVIYNYDGYDKNWIWCCWDGELWCPTSYDMDSIFGQSWDGTGYVNNSDTTILGQSDSLPTGNSLLKGLYQTELRARYKELRDAGVFSVDNIVGLMEKWVNGCGYDNLKNDIENIAVSPYLEEGSVVVDENQNPVLVPNTPSYRDGSKTYQYTPTTGGWYNSILRVKNWLVQRLATLDIYYNYN